MGEEKPAGPEVKPAGKAKLIVRIVLFSILIVVLIAAILHANLRRQAKNAIALYKEAERMIDRSDPAGRTAKLEEAERVLESVIKNPLSAIRLRGPARESLGLVKMYLAVEQGKEAGTVDEYTEIIAILREAHDLNPKSPQINGNLKGYKRRLAMVKMRLAVERATNDQTVAGYTAAIALLRQAYELDTETKAISDRLKEYEDQLKQMQDPSSPPAEPQE